MKKNTYYYVVLERMNREGEDRALTPAEYHEDVTPCTYNIDICYHPDDATAFTVHSYAEGDEYPDAVESYPTLAEAVKAAHRLNSHLS